MAFTVLRSPIPEQRGRPRAASTALYRGPRPSYPTASGVGVGVWSACRGGPATKGRCLGFAAGSWQAAHQITDVPPVDIGRAAARVLIRLYETGGIGKAASYRGAESDCCHGSWLRPLPIVARPQMLLKLLTTMFYRNTGRPARPRAAARAATRAAAPVWILSLRPTQELRLDADRASNEASG